MKKLLVAICLLWAGVAQALTPSERLELSSQVPVTNYIPFTQYNFATSGTLPTWLTFSRASNAMQYDSTGKLVFAPNNLLLNSATLSTQTVTAGIIPTSNVILSFSGTGSVAISGGYTGTLAGTGVSNRVFLKFTTTTASLTFTVTGSVTSAQLERVTYQTSPSTYEATTASQYFGPRFDYNPATTTAMGLYLEEGRTNSFAYSQDFNNAVWTKGNATITTGAVTGPDGQSTGDKLIATAFTGTHFVLRAVTTVAGPYTFSAYGKAAEYNYIFLYNGTLGIGRVFNVLNGTLGGTAGNALPTTSTITSVGNGWYRCAITLTATAASNSWRIYTMQADSASASFLGDGVSGTYIFGADLEQGAFATSYIPTTTSSIARAADSAQITGDALTVAGANIGSIVLQTSNAELASGNYYMVASSATRNVIGTTNTATLASTDANNTAIATVGNGSLITGPSQIAVGWDTNGVAIAGSNGTVRYTSVVLGTSASAFLGGASATVAGGFWFNSIAFYTQRLSNTTLKQKSIVGAPF